MTSYGAYNAGLPCKNTSCKSHGKPHPNCRCYGDMAEGGDVEPYCSETRAHKDDCEYFAKGGEIDPFHSVSGYIAHGGLHGVIRMHHPKSDKSIQKYDRHVKTGHKYIDLKIDRLFNGGAVSNKDISKQKKHIEDWIDQGGITKDIQDEGYNQNDAQQHFAEGGDVEHEKKPHGLSHRHPIESSYPDQNIIMHTIKGRASHYLSALKPQKNQPKLIFDEEPDDREKKKSYDKALHIAAHPMSLMDKVHKGTLEPEHIQHFNAMYPELNEVLQKKLTEQITKAQMDGKRPSYKVRQSLSLLMGVHLSGELTPENIMAAQATFKSGGSAAPAGGGGTPTKKTSALSKSNQSLLTPNQAAASRQQKQ